MIETWRANAQTKSPYLLGFSRADAGTRTPDPFITSEVLYQLSYVGESACRPAGEGVERSEQRRTLA